MQRALRVLARVVGAVGVLYMAIYAANFIAAPAKPYVAGLKLYVPASIVHIAFVVIGVVAVLLALAKVLDYLEAITTRLERLESESAADQP